MEETPSGIKHSCSGKDLTSIRHVLKLSGCNFTLFTLYTLKTRELSCQDRCERRTSLRLCPPFLQIALSSETSASAKTGFTSPFTFHFTTVAFNKAAKVSKMKAVETRGKSNVNFLSEAVIWRLAHILC